MRRQLRHVDKQFRDRNSNRFRLPKRKGKEGSTLLINGKVNSDPSDVLEAWSSHFRNLSSSHEHDFPALDEFRERIAKIVQSTVEQDKDDYILDVPFTLDELSGV